MSVSQETICSEVVSQLYDNIRWKPEYSKLRALLLEHYNQNNWQVSLELDKEVQKAIGKLRVSYSTWCSLGTRQTGAVFEDLCIYLSNIYGTDIESLQTAGGPKEVFGEKDTVPQEPTSVWDLESSEKTLVTSSSCPTLRRAYDSAEGLAEIAKTVTEDFAAEWETVTEKSQDTNFVPHYIENQRDIVPTPDLPEDTIFGLKADQVKWATIIQGGQPGIFVQDDGDEELRALKDKDLVVSLPASCEYSPGAPVWMVGVTWGNRFKSGLTLEELIIEINHVDNDTVERVYITEAAYNQFSAFTQDELNIISRCTRYLTVLRKKENTIPKTQDESVAPASSRCAQQ